MFATLHDYIRQAEIGAALEVDLSDDLQIKELANHFKLPLDLVKLAYVNGIYQKLGFNCTRTMMSGYSYCILKL